MSSENEIELILPMFEEVFYLAAQHERLSKVTRLYAPPFRTLAQVHDKGTFQELCDKLGLRTPQTVVAHDQDELKAAIERFPHYFGRAAFSRGGVGLMTNTGPLAGALSPDDVHPTESNPWLVQEFVDGPMHCTYSCIHDGEVATHMSYRAPRQWEHSTGIQFTSVDPSDTLPSVEKLASELSWDGQMSLDFVDAEQGLMMIECNPRPTDGVLLMTAEELERGLLAPTIETLQIEPGRSEQLDFAVLGQMFRQPLKRRAGLDPRPGRGQGDGRRLARHAAAAVLVPGLLPPRAHEPGGAQGAVRGDVGRDHLGRPSDPGPAARRRRLPGQADRGLMDLGIDGRVALVMGASRGIGRGIAGALAREGVRLAISSRSAEALDEAAGEIGEGVVTIAADSGDLDRMAALPGEVAEALGPVEILVTNTGGPPAGGALDHAAKQWEAAYTTLVQAPRVLAESVIPGMRERGWGRIVNVASTSVREPIPGLALSNAHRMATVGLFKTLATEVAPDGVTVNTVATGLFATDRLASMYGSLEAAEETAKQSIPAGRLGTPDEYGDLVAFICSERAGYLTGTVIPLDGGRLQSH